MSRNIKINLYRILDASHLDLYKIGRKLLPIKKDVETFYGVKYFTFQFRL